ncbi:MAG: CoA ester lyase [Tissierellales bacterium]
MIRSLLFVPCDSERKLAKCPSVGADAIVLDLEDSVLPDRKPLAREMMKEFLAQAGTREQYWVRINDLTSGELLKDLPAVVAAKPRGIIFPKLRGPEDLDLMRNYLDALEAANDYEEDEQLAIAALVTETPNALLRLGEIIRQPQPRVTALMWGGEDLSSALGAGDPRAPDGSWRPTYEYARTQAILASHALGVEAIDTVYVDFRNPEGLRASCQASRYDGFTGRVAIHPDQVAIINDAFTPSAEELDMARRIVEAFKDGQGAVSIDGKMFDIPHLNAARRLLGDNQPN